MMWALFALGAAFAWGVYGPALHKGQTALGNPLKALLCVGFAYFLLGVLVPVAGLAPFGNLTGITGAGAVWSTLGGILGGIGAVCIILAFRYGGVPNYVMPIVFGGAPVVNALVTMWATPPKTPVNPLLYLGMALVAGGAGMVLYFKPAN